MTAVKTFLLFSRVWNNLVWYNNGISTYGTLIGHTSTDSVHFHEGIIDQWFGRSPAQVAMKHIFPTGVNILVGKECVGFNKSNQCSEL